VKKVISSGGSFPFKIEGLHYKTGRPVEFHIVGGIIAGVKELKSLPRDAENLYISPGFIDNQINGFANVDFSGENLTVEGIVSATKAILKEGVTSFMPTLVTNSHENLINNFRILADACSQDKLVRSCCPGFHLEGPFISPEEGFRGCHAVQHIRKPSWKEFSEYQEASGGRIIQVTVAPEVEGAQEFIKKCTAEKIVIAIGHSNASAREIELAVENGARLSTHLGNGCANYIHRHNNPLWAQLADDRLTPSIIADGNHLLPEEIKVFLKTKGIDNIILTSDVIYLAGMAPGKYTFSGMDVLLKEDGMLLNISQNVLAGASFPIKRGVGNMMKFTGIPLSSAVKMASENVAEIYNLKDRGTLELGKQADIILFELKEFNLNIKQTYKEGTLISD
jgi:N-acetylglucosamine-6-phosphate deacetylase